MYTGKKLAAAIRTAIDKYIDARQILGGTICSSRAALAKYMQVSPAAAAGWCKTGAIRKDTLLRLQQILSAVVPPQHFGLTAWPWASDGDGNLVSEPIEQYHPAQQMQWLIDAYNSADSTTQAAVELLLHPTAQSIADPVTTLAIAQLRQHAKKTLTLAVKSSAA